MGNKQGREQSEGKRNRLSAKYAKPPVAQKAEAAPAPPIPLSLAPPPISGPGIKKIAILGGGPSSLACAYYLTNQPDWQKRYSVTIYQMGWRLGGKAASSRDPEHAFRIEEHGIHIFGNYYKNIFDMVKACNDETDWAYIPTSTMDETFIPTGFTCNILHFSKENKIDMNRLALPKNPAKPWDGTEWYGSPADIVYTLLDMMAALLTGQHLNDPEVNEKHDQDRKGNPFEKFFNAIGESIERASVSIGSKILEVIMKRFKKAIEEEKQKEKEAKEKGEMFVHNEGAFDAIIELLEELIHWVRKIAKDAILENVDRLTAYIQLDLYTALIHGILEDRLIFRDADDIDHLTYAEWLTRHGIDVEITLPSPIALIAINSCFQFDDGNSTKRSKMSAASYLVFTVRALFGKGGLIWRWIAGTGETIITPFYAALKKRGVEFKFFHKVDQLHFSGEEITSIDITRQATVKNHQEYNPVKPFWVDKYSKPFWIWDHTPDLEQLEEGEALRGHNLESYWDDHKGTKVVLKKGKDFDQVVLGISVGALPYICKEIIAEQPKWKEMVEHVKTTQTQAIQLWCDRSMQEMGFRLAFNFPDFAVGATFCYSSNAFVDFSDLIEVEHWPEDKKPKTCLYFCGARFNPEHEMDFHDKTYPERQHEYTLYTATQYIQSHMGQLLLPKATIPECPGSFDFDRLVCLDKESKSPPERMRQQHIRANIDPTELYVISNAGSAKYRMHAWDSGYKNLTLIGDWIYTGFNVGSIEGAVMSGALGCFALTGAPTPDNIHGYLFMHPKQVEIAKHVTHPLAPNQNAPEGEKVSKKERKKTKGAN